MRARRPDHVRTAPRSPGSLCVTTLQSMCALNYHVHHCSPHLMSFARRNTAVGPPSRTPPARYARAQGPGHSRVQSAPASRPPQARSCSWGGHHEAKQHNALDLQTWNKVGSSTEHSTFVSAFTIVSRCSGLHCISLFSRCPFPFLFPFPISYSASVPIPDFASVLGFVVHAQSICCSVFCRGTGTGIAIHGP